MRIPYRRSIFPRQALLPPSPNPTTPPLNVPEEGSTPVETPGGAAAPATGTSAATGDGGVAVGSPEGGESVVPNVTPTTRTTTIAPSATASGGSGGLLASAEQATKFTWWQLLCIALGGALLLGVILWAWWKVRRRTAMDKKRAKELEEEEEKGFKEAMEKRQAEQTGKLGKKGKRKGKDKKSGSGRKKRKDEESSDSDDSDSDESYDSVSDGGTIRPKGRKRAKRRHKRHRSGGRRNGRRDGYSDSDAGDSDTSSITYYRPRRGRSHRERRYSDDSGYYSRDRISPLFTPTPPLPTLPKPTRRPTQPLRQPTAPPAKANFRDSVFSTYASMKKAAVRLKYVEAKVKLKKQLEDEDKLEKARQAKVKEANAEIEQDRRRRERAEREQQSASSDRPLIPPVTSHSSGSSRGSMTPYLPTPPGRAATKTYSKDSFRTRQSSADSVRPPPRTQRQPSRHDTFAIPPVKQASRKDSGRSDTGLRSEIHNLLGNDTAHAPRQQTRLPTQSQPRQLVPTKPAVAKVAPVPNNAFQADWLSHPGPAFSVPQTARSGSVYLPVPKPKDRPMIAPGGLAPAPPPKAKSKLGQNTRGPTLPPAPASIAGGASAGGKWADRLRAKR